MSAADLVSQRAEPAKLYSVQAAAEIMSVSPATVWRMIKAGKLRPTRIFGRTLISPEAIDEAIAAAS